MLNRILNRGPPAKWLNLVDEDKLQNFLVRLASVLLALYMACSLFHAMGSSVGYGQFPTPPEGGIVQVALYHPLHDRGDMKLTL